MARRSTKTVTGRRERQEKRRLKAGELFSAGQTRAQVADQCGVTWRSAHEWHRVWSTGGVGALKAATKPGPALKFSEEDVAVLEKELRRGPVAHGD